MSLAKGMTMFVSAFFPELPNREPKDPPEWIVLDIWAYIDIWSFKSVDILLAKTFLMLVVCLVVRNNSCGRSSSSKVFLFNLNIAPVLFFAADFKLFNCAVESCNKI